MNEWQEVRLGDVLDKIVGGGTPSKENPSYWDGGDIFWCSVKDMSDDKFRISQTKDTITVDGLNNSSANLILKGTVITATRMGLGRAFINETDMAINQDLKALIPNSNLDNKYLLWTIILYRNYIEMLGNGATVKGIRLETLKNIKINLPPLPTQKKIAKILSNYDDLIENNLKRIKLLEESARLTYEEWFLRFRIDGKKLEIDTESGLPFGWIIKKLGEVTNFKYGAMPKKELISDHGYPIYSGYRVTGFYEKVMFHEPTLIIVARGVGGTGDVKITPRSCWLTNLSIALLLNSLSMKNYLYYHLKTLNLRSLDSGTAQSQITITSLENLKIISPDIKILQKFEILLIPIINSIENLTNQNQLLKEARDILLPRLMTGMIDTDNMDIAV